MDDQFWKLTVPDDRPSGAVFDVGVTELLQPDGCVQDAFLASRSKVCSLLLSRLQRWRPSLHHAGETIDFEEMRPRGKRMVCDGHEVRSTRLALAPPRCGAVADLLGPHARLVMLAMFTVRGSAQIFVSWAGRLRGSPMSEALMNYTYDRQSDMEDP